MGSHDRPPHRPQGGGVTERTDGYTRARRRRRLLDRLAALLKRKGATVGEAIEAAREAERGKHGGQADTADTED